MKYADKGSISGKRRKHIIVLTCEDTQSNTDKTQHFLSFFNFFYENAIKNSILPYT
jgi:hypothetical protein